jgi:carbamoyltransferase
VRVLGINAIFHDPSAALLVDGEVVAAAEEERFSRREHGKRPVPFSAWELPEQAAEWCLRSAGIDASALDAVAYSFDPYLCHPALELGLRDPWDWLRQEYAQRAPTFLAEVLPGLDPSAVQFVPHHVAHAASAALAAPADYGHGNCAVLVLDSRGEAASHLAGVYRDGALEPLAAQSLPHSLGLLYEDLTVHCGLQPSQVLALASYGRPRFLPELREAIRTTDDGGFTIAALDLAGFAKAARPGTDPGPDLADLAASVQARLEEVILDLAGWLYEAAGGPKHLALAGSVALNCAANARVVAEGPFETVWVQPAAGDAGTALGAALHLASLATADTGDVLRPVPTPALGRAFSEFEIEAELRRAALPFSRPASIAGTAAEVLAEGGLVAWFQGRSEYGSQALGHRSLLAHPDSAERLSEVKGPEQFRPAAPMVLLDRAPELFDGVFPSPHMLFAHQVRQAWRDRIPAVVHGDGTAQPQTVSGADEPLLAALLRDFERRTGLPTVVNAALSAAGRPMVDSPRDVLELFGSAPIDLLAIGPFAVRRGEAFQSG